MNTLMVGAALVAMAFVSAGAVSAQQTTSPPVEVLGGTATPVPQTTAPEWWTFSRGAQRNYLIDVNSVVKTGDDVLVMVARVPKATPAGDYSHTVDQFGIRCGARQSHVVTTSDALEDGVPGEAVDTDEPWDAIAADSLDDGIREIGCEGRRPPPPAYPTIKAYIDAGRP